MVSPSWHGCLKLFFRHEIPPSSALYFHRSYTHRFISSTSLCWFDVKNNKKSKNTTIQVQTVYKIPPSAPCHIYKYLLGISTAMSSTWAFCTYSIKTTFHRLCILPFNMRHTCIITEYSSLTLLQVSSKKFVSSLCVTSVPCNVRRN